LQPCTLENQGAYFTHDHKELVFYLQNCLELVYQILLLATVPHFHLLNKIFSESLLLLLLLFVQTIFFWILLVRQILTFYDINPERRPETDLAIRKSLGINAIELSQQEKEQIQEIFELFDTDGGGSIAAQEMDAAMLALGFKPSSRLRKSGSSTNLLKVDLQKAQSDLEKIDRDGSKTITLDEFTAMMTGEVVGLGPLEAIWSAFCALSCADSLKEGLAAISKSCSKGEDGWGTVSIHGLKRACKEFDIKLTDEELHCMISETDTDGNGVVDKSEFMRIMKNAPWF
jgi:centrin-3